MQQSIQRNINTTGEGRGKGGRADGRAGVGAVGMESTSIAGCIVQGCITLDTSTSAMSRVHLGDEPRFTSVHVRSCRYLRRMSQP